jgi:hypothetical protein
MQVYAAMVADYETTYYYDIYLESYMYEGPVLRSAGGAFGTDGYPVVNGFIAVVNGFVARIQIRTAKIGTTNRRGRRGTQGKTRPDRSLRSSASSAVALLWREQKRVFLLTHDREFEKVRRVVKGEIFQIAAAGEKSVYSNRP